MAVHVWKDDEYIGQIASFLHEVGVTGEHPEKQALLDALMAAPPMNDAGGIELRFGNPLGNQHKQWLEFPSEDWLAVSALLYLVPKGYRVHITSKPSTAS